MYFVDNGSAVPVMPQVKPVSSATPQFFTEGGNGTPPTYPGPDWFNIVQTELLNLLKEAGIDPDKANHAQLLAAMKKLFLTRSNPFADIKADGPAAVAAALSNLGLGNLVDALIKTNNLSDLPNKAASRTNLGVPKGVDKQMCNEWCVFNGVNTVTMGDSLGISSVTRTGVGQYTVNLSTPYATTNYAVMGRWTSPTIDRDHELALLTGRTTSSFQLYCASDSSNVYPATDAVELSLAIWGAK